MTATPTIQFSQADRLAKRAPKPKSLLIIAHDREVLSKLTRQYSAEYNKQRGWTVIGALVDMYRPEHTINDDGTLTAEEQRRNGCQHAFDTPAQLKAILEAVKPDAILAHEYAVNHPERAHFRTPQELARAVKQITPDTPYVIEGRSRHMLDDADDVPDTRPAGCGKGIVSYEGVDYSINERAIHAHLKAGVEARRGKAGNAR